MARLRTLLVQAEASAALQTSQQAEAAALAAAEVGGAKGDGYQAFLEMDTVGVFEEIREIVILLLMAT